MRNHEGSCTANPSRICRMHKHCEEPQKPIKELVSLLAAHATDKSWPAATEELREATDGCPACMLSAIRQSGLQKAEQDAEGFAPGVDFGFDFKAELKSFWDTVNDAKAECSERSFESVYY
jgi:hypothetical protein